MVAPLAIPTGRLLANLDYNGSQIIVGSPFQDHSPYFIARLLWILEVLQDSGQLVILDVPVNSVRTQQKAISASNVDCLQLKVYRGLDSKRSIDAMVVVSLSRIVW